MKIKIKSKFPFIFKKKSEQNEKVNPFIEKMKDLLEEDYISCQTRGRQTPNIMQREFDIEINCLLREIGKNENRLKIIEELVVVLKEDIEISKTLSCLTNEKILICNPLRRNRLAERLEKLSLTSKSWIAVRSVSKKFFILEEDKQWTMSFEGLNKYIGREILEYLPFSRKFLNHMSGIKINSSSLPLLKTQQDSKKKKGQDKLSPNFVI